MKRTILLYNSKLKKFARELRKNMTLAKILLWQHLRKKQMLGFSFERQRPIDKYITDFYCKELKLAIEVDGASHNIPKVNEKDISRQNYLESFGISFLRFTEQEVCSNMEGVLLVIKQWIEQRRFTHTHP